MQDLSYKIAISKWNFWVSKDIVLVEIDSETLNNLWRFPFDRKHYIPVLENLNNLWSEIIWLDILFPDKSDIKSDLAFAEAIKNAWNIVLWTSVYEKNSKKIIEKPYHIIWKNAYSSGLLSPNIDKNWKVYDISPFSIIDSDIIEPFSFAIFKAYYSKFYNDSSIKDISFYLDKASWSSIKYSLIDSLDFDIFLSKDNKSFLLRYNPSNLFERVSFYDVYSWKYDKDLTSKIVIIWPTASWLKDEFFTPLWKEKGVYIHANALNTLMTKNFLVYLDKNIEKILIFIFIFFICYFNFLVKTRHFILNSVFITVSLLVLLVWFSSFSIVPNYFANLIFWIILIFIFTSILNYFLEKKHKSKLMKALSQYVSKDIAKRILETRWDLDFSWEEREITLMFSDIKDFTSITEKISPKELISFLREYLSYMSDIIMDEKWFIDKYQWDSIMSAWGIFSNKEDQSYLACLSALKQRNKLKSLNRNWSVPVWEIEFRIWIHKWKCVIWNIWSPWRKVEYTALWDNVNLASRLEWINKYYWTDICASSIIYEENKEFFEFRYLDTIRVKWKENHIDIYELIAEKWTLNEAQSHIISKYMEAMSLYKNFKFEEALDIFNSLVSLWDKPSFEFKKRCEGFILNPPSEDYDFIWWHNSK